MGQNIFDIIKIIVALSGFIALIAKLKESFSNFGRRQRLKIDLEILNLAKKDNSIQDNFLEKSIRHNMDILYNWEKYPKLRLLDVLMGLVLFVGFSWWTINIFEKYNGFNGWAILTMIVASVGLSLVFGDNERKSTKGEFYRIEFHDRTNFRIGILITIITSISLISIILSTKSFPIWGLLSIITFGLIGLATVIQNIKLKKIHS